MVNKILISIKPKFVNLMFKGMKKYEYRTKEGKFDQGAKIFVYCTSPIKKIVGFFTCGGVLVGTPNDIWAKTNQESGLNKGDFFSYYKNKEKAIAIRISNPKEFKSPCELEQMREIFKNFNPPQSFYYLNESEKYANLLSFLDSLRILNYP